MKSYVLLALACASVAPLAGCAGPEVRAHIDSVNSEYRQLEDYVYCLEDENARLQRTLDNVQDNYERVLRGEQPRRPGPFQRPAEEASGSAADEPPPTIEIPGSSSAAPPARDRSTLQRPEIDSPASGPNNSSAPMELEIPPIPGGDDLPTPAIPRTSIPGQPETLPPPADTKVTHLFLNPLLTGGADFDRQPGDEGLTVVIEPRNAGDEYVPQAGAVSIVVLDPSRQDESARIARWDFTLTATQEKLQTASAARGIKLEMPWPASPPTANQLKLFVRYETADGRRLQTERDIYITPPGQVVSRWTPRPADRLRPAETATAAPLPRLPSEQSPSEADPPAAIATAPPKLLAPRPAADDKPTGKLSAPKWSPSR